MNDREVGNILALIAAALPNNKEHPGTQKVWGTLLADVPYDAALQAVKTIVSTSTPFAITPAMIRQQVAEDLGLLPPDEETAWVSAMEVAIAEGEGLHRLHPSVRDAYMAVGGASALRVGGTTLVAQFRDFYRSSRQRRTTEILRGDLGKRAEAIEAHPARKELPPTDDEAVPFSQVSPQTKALWRERVAALPPSMADMALALEHAGATRAVESE